MTEGGLLDVYPMADWEGRHIDESLHWEINLGKIPLPQREMEKIGEHQNGMNHVLRLLFHIYLNALYNSQLMVTAHLAPLVSRLVDPYLPGICKPEGREELLRGHGDEVDFFHKHQRRTQ